MDDIEMRVADALIKAQEKEIDALKLQVSAKDGFISDLQTQVESFREMVKYKDRLNDELKKALCVRICGTDFPGFAVGEHMPTCPLRTPCQRPHSPTSSPALYADGIRSIQCGNCEIQVPLLPPTTEKQKGLPCCGEDHSLLQGVPCPKQFRECPGCREAGTYCEAHRLG